MSELEKHRFQLDNIDDIRTAWRATAISGLGESAFKLLDGYLQIYSLVPKTGDKAADSIASIITDDEDLEITQSVIDSLRLVWENLTEDQEFNQKAFNLLVRLSPPPEK